MFVYVWLQVCTCDCSAPEAPGYYFKAQSAHAALASLELTVYAGLASLTEIWQLLPPECRIKACITEPCIIVFILVLIMCMYAYIFVHVRAGAHRDLWCLMPPGLGVVVAHLTWVLWTSSGPLCAVNTLRDRAISWVFQLWIIFLNIFSFCFFEYVWVFCLHVCFCTMYTVPTKVRSGSQISWNWVTDSRNQTWVPWT